MGNAASDCASVPDLHMTDEQNCRAQQRVALLHNRREFNRAFTRRGTHVKGSIRSRTEVAELTNPIDVDNHRWLGEPQVKQRHEALATGQDLRVVPVSLE